MEISRPEIIKENGELIYRVRIRSGGETRDLWFKLEEQYGDMVTDFSDAPLVGLLIPAMARGEDIRIEGKLSEKLLYDLSGPLQHLLQIVIPSLRKVKISASEIHGGDRKKGPGVAAGFSGGIDSFCLLGDHYYSDVPSGFKVTHLLFYNVGSHGANNEKLFRERYARLKPLTERIGLPFVWIDSNLASFYPKAYDFLQTHSIRNVSAALLLQNGIRRYLFASGYNYAQVFVGACKEMAYIDTIALPLLSTEALDAISVGSESTRVEKTIRVEKIADSHSMLDVCVNHRKAGNCSVCWKCMRTLLTLDIAGLLESYSDSFDLNAYYHQRDQYIGSMLYNKSSLWREIVQLAKERKYSFPIRSYIFAWLKFIIELIIRIARNVKKSITSKARAASFTNK